MKHYEKVQRLYTLLGRAEGAFLGLEECLKTINPNAAKHCGEIRRELEALSKEMEMANLCFTVKDYTPKPEPIIDLSKLCRECGQVKP